MKPELSHSGEQAEKKKISSEITSLTDWERIKNLRDEDIILDEEHPEADPAHMTHIKIWKNGELVREIN